MIENLSQFIDIVTSWLVDLDWSSGVPIALGGLVSGLVGVAYSDFRYRRNEQQTLKRWFERVANYASQITYGIQRYEEHSDGSQLQSTCTDLAPRLRDHIVNSPADIDENLIHQIAELRIYCERVSELNMQSLSGRRQRLDDPENDIQTLATIAESAQDDAENEIENLDWIYV